MANAKELSKSPKRVTISEQILSGKIKATGLGKIPAMYKSGQITRKEALYRINLLLSTQKKAINELPMPAGYYARTRGKVPSSLKPVRLKSAKLRTGRR